MPHVSTDLDYEAKLAVVIGKPGRYIHAAQAMLHVAGFACFNDGSVRDWQFHSHQVTPGKNFVSTAGFGPWLVTADAVTDAAALDIQLTLNGTVLQPSNTRHLISDVPYLIAYLSSFMTLQTGDVIATGTPAGMGFSRKPPLFLKPGDVCEVSIEQVGTPCNGVVRDSGAP